jgi:hypothetical protein
MLARLQGFGDVSLYHVKATHDRNSDHERVASSLALICRGNECILNNAKCFLQGRHYFRISDLLVPY